MERMGTPEMGATLLPAGSELGPWRVVRCVGQGMFGTVYRVERVDGSGPQSFALKLLNYPNDPRFEREVELLRRIRHGHVPRLHDVGRWKHGSGTLFPYFVMDWVQGAPLYPWAAARRISSREVLWLLSQVARALEATHAVGGLHRDVKGANVLVRAEDSAAVLVDFGAGTFRGAAPLTWHALPPGTPHYRSPEALRFYVRWHPDCGLTYEATAADDLYALGVMAYRLVTGIYPPPHIQVEGASREEEDNTPKWVPPEVLATVSPQLAALIKQLLSVEPSARGNARQVAEALERAARTAGKKADAPITARSAQAAPAYLRWARARRPVLARLAWLTVGAVAGMVLGLWVTRPQEPARVDPSVGNFVGRVEEEEVSPVRESKPAATREVIGLELPNEPLPGQLRAPCKNDYEDEIRGGCWVSLRKKKPPCGQNSYEWKGACYLASFPPKRPDTSGKP